MWYTAQHVDTLSLDITQSQYIFYHDRLNTSLIIGFSDVVVDESLPSTGTRKVLVSEPSPVGHEPPRARSIICVVIYY
jgi:hypothetical protein